MAILDEIFKKRNNPSTSFLPVNEQEMQEEANRMPDIPETKASDVEDKQPAEVVNTQQETAPTPNKWGYSDSDVSYLGKMGYTPERLEQIANFDPSKGNNFLQHLYESTVSKPTAPDEKKMRNARLWSGISDGVGMLSQMWSVGKGAHMRERDYTNSALSQTEAKEKEARDRYTKASQMYDNGRFQARMKDYLKALEDHNNDRNNIQNILNTRTALEEKARQADGKLQQGYDKMVQDQANKDKDYELRRRNNESLDAYRKRMAAASEIRAKSTTARTNHYIANGGNKSNKNTPLYFKDGTKIEIPNDVWKANYPVLVDLLAQSGVQVPLTWQINVPNATQVEYFIKQNKDSLPKEAREWLFSISNQQAAEYGSPQYTPSFENGFMPENFEYGNEEEIDYPEDGDEDEDFPIVGSMNVATF